LRGFVAVVVACAVLAAPAAAKSPRGPAKVVENSIGMTLVLVPAGEFVQGNAESPESLARAFPGYERRRIDELADERPAHRVRITHAFYLGRHEVTVGQFRRFVEESGYVPESIADGTGGYGYKPEPYDPASPAPPRRSTAATPAGRGATRASGRATTTRS